MTLTSTKLSVLVLALAGAALAAPTVVPNDPSRFKFFQPSPLSTPCDLAAGVDGAVWAQDLTNNVIMRIDDATGQVDEYKIPYTAGSQTRDAFIRSLEPERLALACAIVQGKDGNLYAASGLRSQFLRINPKTKEIKVYTPPAPSSALGNLEPFNELAPAATGVYVTFTTTNSLFFFDYKTEEFTSYPYPAPLTTALGAQVTSDGAVWLAFIARLSLARFDPVTKTFDEYPLPLPQSAGTVVVRAEAPAGRLWFVASGAGNMGSIDIKTRKYYDFVADPSGPLSAPIQETQDSHGKVWYNTLGRSTLNRIDPATNKVTIIAQPDAALLGTLTTLPNTLNIGIVHYAPTDAMYFAEIASNRVGRYQL